MIKRYLVYTLAPLLSSPPPLPCSPSLHLLFSSSCLFIRGNFFRSSLSFWGNFQLKPCRFCRTRGFKQKAERRGWGVWPAAGVYHGWRNWQGLDPPGSGAKIWIQTTDCLLILAVLEMSKHPPGILLPCMVVHASAHVCICCTCTWRSKFNR